MSLWSWEERWGGTHLVVPKKALSSEGDASDSSRTLSPLSTFLIIAPATNPTMSTGGRTMVDRSTSPGLRRSPSVERPSQPVPTRLHTDDGRPILFYVTALYDYSATTDEEFDFQEGDLIAVTATPADGWWSGELLDETRRQTGRHMFPSNFVSLY